MSRMLVVTGPPGAGKSTVARLLAEEVEPSVLVDGDAFFRFLARGAIEPWVPEANAQNEIVTRAAASAAGQYAAGGYTTIYDGIVGPWFLPTFAAATGLTELDYVILLPSEERCVRGVLTRVDHGFGDEAATRKMHAEFDRATVDARHVVEPPPEAAATAGVVHASWQRGDFVVPVTMHK